MPSTNLTARMYFDQGRQSFASRDFDAACDLFNRAVTTDPQFHEAHRYLAEGYEKLGYRHRARKAWEALLRITQEPDQREDVEKRLLALQ